VLRVTMIAFMKGTSPLLAAEMGRRAIPGHVRPSFQEFEASCKRSAAATGASSEVAPAAEAAGAAQPAAAC
jgi:chemotaxis protein MotA